MTFNDDDDDDEKLSNLPEGITFDVFPLQEEERAATNCYFTSFFFLWCFVSLTIWRTFAFFLVIIISEGNCCCSPSLCQWALKVRPILSDSLFTKKFDTQRVQVCQAPALTLATSELSSLRIGTLLLEN